MSFRAEEDDRVKFASSKFPFEDYDIEIWNHNKNQNFTIGTEESFHPPVVETSSCSSGFRCKKLSNQAYCPKVLQSSRSWGCIDLNGRADWLARHWRGAQAGGCWGSTMIETAPQGQRWSTDLVGKFHFLSSTHHQASFTWIAHSCSVGGNDIILKWL